MADNFFKVRKGLIVNGSGSTIFDIQGSQGQLFSVTDNLQGSLFAVNDISGIPIMEVFSDDTVKLGTFNDEAIIVTGSKTTIQDLQATGSFTGSFIGDGSQLTNVDAELLDGQNGAYYLNYNNFTNTPSIPTVNNNTITIDTLNSLTGGGSFTLNQNNNQTIQITHPTFDGDDINIDTGALTGATVISDLDFNITTNTEGHVTDANGVVSTRNITLSDLGYTGPTNPDNYQYWNLKTNGTQRKQIQSTDDLDIVEGTNISIGYSAGGVVTINSTDTNTFLSNLSFNTGDGKLTATLNNNNTESVDLDGRYVKISGDTMSGDLTINSRVLLSNGNSTTPSYSFSSDINTGITLLSPNNLGIITGGVISLDIGNNYIYSRNQHLFVDGSETVPSISFQNDKNTGIYRPTTDNISLTTKGSERIRINDIGNIGIGNTTPSSKLEVTGNVTVGYTNAAPTNGMIVNGDVGIGTNNPSAKLHLDGLLRVDNSIANSTPPLIGASITGVYTNTGDVRSALGSPDKWLRIVVDEGNGPQLYAIPLFQVSS